MAVMLFSQNLSNPKIFTEITDKISIENGNTELFWDDGSLKGRGRIVNSSKTGNWVYFHPGTNGTQKLFEGAYLNGKRNGIWKEFDEKGKLLATVGYSNGVLNGEVTVFFENSNIPHTTKLYRNGIQTGAFAEHYPKGNLKERSMYVNGQRDGAATFFYPSGKIHSRGSYSKGFKEGRWQYNDEKGLPLESGTYSNGIKTGAWANPDNNNSMNQKGG